MLALNDPAWSRLTDAYGPATRIPSLLERLRDGSDAEAWDALWSALCHQCTVYPATYAAVPHVVALAEARSPHERGEFLDFLAMAIACSSAGGVPSSGPDLAPAYGAAVARTRVLAVEAMADIRLPQPDLPAAAAALAAARGDAATAFDFMNAGEPHTCPECDARVPSWGEWLTT